VLNGLREGVVVVLSILVELVTVTVQNIKATT
jgi:hypothetical protein